MTKQTRFFRVISMTLAVAVAVAVVTAVGQNCPTNQPAGWSCYKIATKDNSDANYVDFNGKCGALACAKSSQYPCAGGLSFAYKRTPRQQSFPYCFSNGTLRNYLRTEVQGTS